MKCNCAIKKRKENKKNEKKCNVEAPVVVRYKNDAIRRYCVNNSLFVFVKWSRGPRKGDCEQVLSPGRSFESG